MPLSDTSIVLSLPKSLKTRTLTQLACENCFLNPFPHRAISDCLTAMKLLQAYDWKMVEALANSPSMTIRANVSYDDRAKASERGYRWNAEKKIWFKEIKQMNLDEEMQGCPFKVVILNAGN